MTRRSTLRLEEEGPPHSMIHEVPFPSASEKVYLRKLLDICFFSVQNLLRRIHFSIQYGGRRRSAHLHAIILSSSLPLPGGEETEFSHFTLQSTHWPFQEKLREIPLLLNFNQNAVGHYSSFSLGRGREEGRRERKSTNNFPVN